MDSMRKLLAIQIFQNNNEQVFSMLNADKIVSDEVQPHWRHLLDKIYENINEQSPHKPNHKDSDLLQSTKTSTEDQGFKCKCKKTKCLKLYCECFAKGEYCKNCNCQCCNNTSEHDLVRSSAIDQIFQKNPNAFDMTEKPKNAKCICKKIGCLKKYCECYSLGKKCGEDCKCVNCEN